MRRVTATAPAGTMEMPFCSLMGTSIAYRSSKRAMMATAATMAPKRAAVLELPQGAMDFGGHARTGDKGVVDGGVPPWVLMSNKARLIHGAPR